MTVLSLGGVVFQGFELAGRIVFGGAQAMKVHRLPGGVRVIDVLGRDDADIRWSGILAGGDAGDRARLLDAMRAAGAASALSWDAFLYDVIIAECVFDYRNPWWIPYRMRCKVLSDETDADVAPAVSAAFSVAGDLASAGALVPVAAAIASVGVTGALTGGTLANAAARTVLDGAQAALGYSIVSAESGVLASDPAAVASSAGALAQATAASGFVSRALVNFDNAGV